MTQKEKPVNKLTFYKDDIVIMEIKIYNENCDIKQLIKDVKELIEFDYVFIKGSLL